MNNIVDKLDYYKRREKPEKYTHYKIAAQGPNHLSKVKKERDYCYYKCDYCNEEIKILKNEKNVDGNNIASGGLWKVPQSLTHEDSSFYLALCNKCLKPVAEQFERAGLRKIEKLNYNHIPRID